jgi:protein-L-isoaspartate(D-aspartate) O-methyltransferase
MNDFAVARRMMVDGQVRTSDVTDPRLIAAMLEIPREQFVPDDKAALAYLDFDIPVSAADGAARCLLKPMVLAKLIQAADIRDGNHVLDIGCTTGYSSAVLAQLAQSVVALEQEASLARLASENLARIGAHNVTVATGPLTEGWSAGALYDVILLNGATEVVPKELLPQLKDGGRLVGVLGRAPAGKAMLYYSDAGDISGRPIFDAAAPVLPGFVAPPAFVF